MRIVHLISSLRRGGRERQLANILANTNQSNYPTIIIYYNKIENSYIDEYNLEVFTRQIKAKGKFKRIKELHKVLRKEKPDIVYTWGNGESISILFLGLLHRFKFINGSVRHGIRANRLSHYIRTLVLHLSQFIVANSRAGLKANKLRRGSVLSNGIDQKFFNTLDDKPIERKRLTGIDNQMMLFISVANLVPYKDYFTVLRALKEIKGSGYQFRYLIIGEGPERKSIEDYIEQAKLKENVIMGGTKEDVEKYLKVSDLFIHSSRGEGTSNAILEAMAVGLPVIATKTGGTPEIIPDGQLFDYKNNEQLEQLLVDFYDKKKRKHVGAEMQKKAREKFTIAKMMMNYYQILNNVQNKKGL